MYGLSGNNSVYNNQIPMENFKLSNSPNPFNPATTIHYNLPDNVENPIIEIFNIKGEKIRTFNCQNQMPIIWDGKDSNNKSVASGIYFYKISAGKSSAMKKMLLLK